MNKEISAILDYLFSRSTKKWALKCSQLLLNFATPFNAAHKPQFIKIERGSSTLRLPYKRANKNHLGGIHACAIATLGEFAAGITLIRVLGFSNYRLIMRELNVNYYLQARSAATGKATIEEDIFINIKKELSLEGSSEVKVVTEVYDTESNHIATVNTLWQLKSWKKVSFK